LQDDFGADEGEDRGKPAKKFGAILLPQEFNSISKARVPFSLAD